MPIAYKVLGQNHPTGSPESNLYTVPAGTQTIVSTLTITNTTGTPTEARVWVRVNGAATSSTNNLMYDAQVAGNTVAAFTLGLTLSAGDIVTVRSASGNRLTFQLFGSEITA
jgi:hypothetical protein